MWLCSHLTLRSPARRFKATKSPLHRCVPDTGHRSATTGWTKKHLHPDFFLKDTHFSGVHLIKRARAPTVCKNHLANNFCKQPSRRTARARGALRRTTHGEAPCCAAAHGARAERERLRLSRAVHARGRAAGHAAGRAAAGARGRRRRRKRHRTHERDRCIRPCRCEASEQVSGGPGHLELLARSRGR